MIAWLGAKMFKAGISFSAQDIKNKTLDILPYQRTDEVEVTWRKG
jgi:hypothetical protein